MIWNRLVQETRQDALRTGLAVAAVVLAGVAIGLGVTSAPLTVMAVGAALLAAVLLAALMRWPPLVPAAFWLGYSLQFTLFYGFTVQGLYYPLYLIMAGNAILALYMGGLRIDVRALLPYAAFFFLVLLSVPRTEAALDFEALQQIFVYFLGFLVVVQFSRRGSKHVMAVALVLASLAIALWVIERSVASGFAERAGIEIDQNTISFFMSFGLLIFVSRLLARRVAIVYRLFAWAGLGVGAYALLLLASRGVSLAFVLAAFLMYLRISKDLRRSASVALPTVLATILILSLPGSDALFDRFQQADIATANSRLPLWRAGFDAFTDFGPLEILFGRGLDSSERLMQRVLSSITSTHNAYLQVLLEFGLLGFAAFVTLHARLLWRFWHAEGAMASYGVGAVSLMLMANMTLTTPDEFLYWVALGHLIAVQTSLGGRSIRRPTSAGRGLRYPPRPIRAATLEESIP